MYIGSVVAQPTGDRAERFRVLSSSPFADNNWKGVLVGGRRGANTPSEHCQAALVQGTKSQNAQVGHCSKLETDLGVYSVFSPIQLG